LYLIFWFFSFVIYQSVVNQLFVFIFIEHNEKSTCGGGFFRVLARASAKKPACTICTMLLALLFCYSISYINSVAKVNIPIMATPIIALYEYGN